MKHWQELAHIAGRVARLGEAARRKQQQRFAALATVTRIEGSAYRRPGARLLIEPDGPVTGGVSGGCLEEDVRRIGLASVQSGKARRLHYDTGDDEGQVWGLGLGCNGAVDLVVQPIGVGALDLFGGLQARLRADEPFALSAIVDEPGAGGFLLLGESGHALAAVDPEAAGLAAEIEAAASAALLARRSAHQVAGGRQVFTEVLLPPPKLLVCGAGDDTRPLSAFAAAIGFRVFVADHRPALLTPARFPEAQKLTLLRPEQPAPAAELPTDRDTFAVVKTHGFEHDRRWVARLLASDVAYLGLLGPRARAEKILAQLPPEQRGRVFAPVGLDLGADGPEQVALSVVSELLAVWSGRRPQHLRERNEALHVCA
jgi:xanthine dehydrogenase accessory factor